MANFFTDEEAAIIEAFVSLSSAVGSRAMSSGFMADGPRAVQYGAMLERLTIATREAERLFSLAAWRLDCERSWDYIRSRNEQDAAMLADMEEEA